MVIITRVIIQTSYEMSNSSPGKTSLLTSLMADSQLVCEGLFVYSEVVFRKISLKVPPGSVGEFFQVEIINNMLTSGQSVCQH